MTDITKTVPKLKMAAPYKLNNIRSNGSAFRKCFEVKRYVVTPI